MASPTTRDNSPGSEDEEDFVDAPENQVPTDEEDGEEEDDDDGDGDNIVVGEQGQIGRAYRGEDMDLDEEKVVEDDEEEDLFESTFGGKPVDDSDDENETAPTQNQFVATEHTNGCTSNRGPPTPPPATSRPVPPPAPLLDRCDHPPPNPVRDQSWALRRLTGFYNRAKELTPRLPLPEHRYWIGVLIDNKNFKSFKQEKDFLWMKGNRKSTVETIWNMYQQSTATENFVLLLGYETVDFKDTVEELDYFGDKKVIFRAVLNDDPDAKGRELTQDCVKYDVEPAKKKVVQEVMILDDEYII